MVDLLLLAGRLLLVALLYLFLFFVVKTGVGLVRGQNKKEKSWTLNVEKGPRTLKGGQEPFGRGPQLHQRHPAQRASRHQACRLL